MQERNRLYEEVHGVVEGQSHQEELEFVAQRLFEFDYNFSTIRNKPAHDYPENVYDRAFCFVIESLFFFSFQQHRDTL
jgi:hypothetical protein